MSLQDIDCRYAQAKSKTYKLSDGNQLYLLVTTTGKKYWRYDFIFFGKRKTLALGSYPDVSLADARTARKAATDQILQGIDPISQRQQDKLLSEYKNAQTVEQVFREWHAQFYDTWSERTAHVILRRLEIYIFPHIGAIPQDMVTPQMLLTCLLRAEKNSRDVAERLLKYSYRAFLFAHNTGRKNDDPTKGLIYNLKRYKRGHFAAIDINELPTLLEAIETEDRRITRQTYLAMRLLMLTAVRTNELIKMKWSEIHFDLKQWIIPGERNRIILCRYQNKRWVFYLK
jgi:integrase